MKGANTGEAWGGGSARALGIPTADPESGRREAWDGREFRQARVTDRPLVWGSLRPLGDPIIAPPSFGHTG